MAEAEQRQADKAPISVVVRDFDMHFGSIVVLLVKFSLAAIPAMFLLGAFAAGIYFLIRVLFGGS